MKQKHFTTNIVVRVVFTPLVLMHGIEPLLCPQYEQGDNSIKHIFPLEVPRWNATTTRFLKCCMMVEQQLQPNTVDPRTEIDCLI